MHEFTVFELERRSRDALERGRSLAHEYGQLVARRTDLYILEQIVKVAVDSGSADLLEHALKEVGWFQEKLMTAQVGGSVPPELRVDGAKQPGGSYDGC